MESKKAFLLLTLVFSLLMIEKSMVCQVLAQYSPPLPDNDHSRSEVYGSHPEMDKKRPGNSSDGGEIQVPPPATKTTIEVAIAVSPTSNASSTSVSSSSHNSSTRRTGGGTTSQSSSSQVNKHSSNSSSSSHVTYP